ncbi:uncharacterized protein METZ01_LOCUS333035, partial [marine metagenome]
VPSRQGSLSSPVSEEADAVSRVIHVTHEILRIIGCVIGFQVLKGEPMG